MRRLHGLLIASVVATAVGCSAYPPYLLTATPDVPVDRMSAVEAAVVTLQDAGYTITTANENLGIVTTDWMDKTSLGTMLVYGGSDRKRVSIHIVRTGDKLTVQITKQTKSLLRDYLNRWCRA